MAVATYYNRTQELNGSATLISEENYKQLLAYRDLNLMAVFDAQFVADNECTHTQENR